ncbi:hypothetical protein PG994_005248 [Apiospora phragmitis]|uniref:O-methyltransferase domain-containing protein n=1 Tax=Apiospora phragmitis TaxID=2905665 RepID=A0ABR1VSW0_9PEZI
MKPSSLTPATEQIIATLDGIGATDLAGDRQAQIAVAAAARRMLARIQTPFEHVLRYQIDAGIAATCQVLLDLGLWKGWTEAGGKDASLVQLVDYCSPVAPDMNLLGRLLRYLASEYVVKEVGVNMYRPTAYSLELGKPTSATTQALLVCDHHWLDSCRHMPAFLAKTGYQEPLDPVQSNYADWTPEKLTLFARMQTNPAYAVSFTGWMAGLVGYKADWTDAYDTKDLVEGFFREREKTNSSSGESSGSGTLLVDIGGSHGLDVSSLLAKHPDLPAGSLVLQDLTHVTAHARVDPDKVTVMAHDFFDPQPVRGEPGLPPARDPARLGRPGLPADPAARVGGHDARTGVSMYQAAVDTGLMFLVSARERTEGQWRLLLKSAGFRVQAIWWPAVSGTEAVIEAELCDGDDDEGEEDGGEDYNNEDEEEE